MDELNKYIGLVHKYQGHGSYSDCLNLVQRFYKDHGYQPDFDDHRVRPGTYDEYIKTQPTRMVRYLLKHFDKTSDIQKMEYGDVALVLIGGDPHLGVIVNDNKLLTMEIPVVEGKSKSTLYRPRYWKPYFRLGFKRRK